MAGLMLVLPMLKQLVIARMLSIILIKLSMLQKSCPLGLEACATISVLSIWPDRVIIVAQYCAGGMAHGSDPVARCKMRRAEGHEKPYTFVILSALSCR